MSVPWSSHVFAKHLKEYGCDIPSGCVEVKFICTPDICRVAFKIMSLSDEYCEWVKQEFNETVSSGVRRVITGKYENCHSYIVTAKINEVVTTEVLQYGGVSEANLISNLFK
jgi:hypothetical protein